MIVGCGGSGSSTHREPRPINVEGYTAAFVKAADRCGIFVVLGCPELGPPLLALRRDQKAISLFSQGRQRGFRFASNIVFIAFRTEEMELFFFFLRPPISAFLW